MSLRVMVSWFAASSSAWIWVSWKGDLHRVCCDDGGDSAAGIAVASGSRAFFLGGLIGCDSVNGDERPHVSSPSASSPRRRF
jgi:hypothetical protein